jgi:uncharacterized iron-regulated protein
MHPETRPSTAFRDLVRAAALPAGLAATLAAGWGCTRNPYDDAFWYYQPETRATVIPRVQSGPRSLAMFRGDTGDRIDWYGLSVGIRWADIVIVGEQHDDANAHVVQEAIVGEAIAAWPGTAVSMEMLERDEQPTVDAYLRGEISRADFIERTGSADWASKGSWDGFYQPVIEAARLGGCPVVAANAPRRFVRMARTEGYDALRALPPEERALFSLPERDAPDTYRARFKDFMESGGAEHDDAHVDRVMLAQRLWDATMADSIARARASLPRDAKVIHLVGQFHSEYDGGLVSEIQARAPGAKVLTVTVQKGEARALRDEDRNKADVVVYGVAPMPEWRMFRAGQVTSGPPARKRAEEELPSWGFAY